MSRKTHQASAIALASMLVFTVAGVAGSGAFAQDSVQSLVLSPDTLAEQDDNSIRFVSNEVVQSLPETTGMTAIEGSQMVSGAASLNELIASVPTQGDLSKDMHCLAGAIYFESRGEPLTGQLAVGRVIVNRAASNRFPSSYCGVVYQRSQFSFVKGGRMPSIAMGSAAWRKAKAIAKVAHESLWDSPAKGALFFHAAHVSPRWRLTRVGRVSSHIFYR